MNNRFLTIVIVTVTSIALTACAQSKKSTASATAKVAKTSKGTDAKKSNRPILLQATKQKTLPGRPESKPTTETLFVIVWQDDAEPGGFFWKGQENLDPCYINKVNNYRPLVVKDNGMPFMMNYQIDRKDKNFSKGDTLQLSPMAAGKTRVPAEIPSDAKYTIYYKTAGSKWQALPVDSIINLPPIAMP